MLLTGGIKSGSWLVQRWLFAFLIPWMQTVNYISSFCTFFCFTGYHEISLNDEAKPFFHANIVSDDIVWQNAYYEVTIGSKGI